MKKAIWILALLVMVGMTGKVWALPGDKFTSAWTVTVGELGDAKIEIKFRYDAQTYAIWQRKYGINPSLLRRDLGKFLTPYEIADRSFEVDDRNKMDREIVVRLVAKGYMTCKADDVWQTEFPKKYQRGDRVGNTYTFYGSSKMDDGRVMEESVRLVLPQAASDYRERLDEHGNTLILYKLAVVNLPMSAVSSGGASEAAPAAVPSKWMLSGAGMFGMTRYYWFGAAALAAFFGFVFLLAGVVIRGKPAAAR